MLTVESFNQLLTVTGQAALHLAQSLDLRPEARLKTVGELRRQYPAALATDALEMAVLRERARVKFRRGAELYWTREALEQASGEAVATHRAERYRGWESATDVCCSVGGDLLALAQADVSVTGVDRDAVRLRMAEVNAEIYGVADRTRWLLADVTTDSFALAPAVFFDPARRSGEHRRFNPDDYSPPLRTIERWLPQVAGLGAKVAPGIDYDALPWQCEVEVVSVGGEVKEAVLWFGQLQQGSRTATVLPAAAILRFADVAAVAVIQPLRYLYEPDGAVIRAHLVQQLAHLLDAAQIDLQIAFLTSDNLRITPFARAFEVIETVPWNLKQLRSRLRQMDVGHVVVKKRGSPIDPQWLEKQLRPVGEDTITVILTQVLGRPVAILCRPLPA